MIRRGAAVDDAGGLRVLIVAEDASATYGGEAVLPLHYFRLLRRRGVEAWLIVHSRTRPELEKLLPAEAGRISYVEDTWQHKTLWAVGRRLPARMHYFTLGLVMRVITQVRARQIAAGLIRRHGIDLIHQPTPVSPKDTSILHGLGVPLVIGPMNGGMSFPPGFRAHEGPATRALVGLGRAVAPVVHRLMPGKLRADTLLVANDRTRRALPRGVTGRVVTLVENGVDLSLWDPGDSPDHPSAGDGGDRVRFLFVGRLVDWKAVDLLLEAFAKAGLGGNVTLDVLGSGPMDRALRAKSAGLGLTERVTFHGWVPQADLAARLRQGSALVLPSLLECGGAVVLEAMAAGLPVIATDWGGPSDYLDSTCGILVAPTDRGGFVAGLADALRALAGSPETRARLGRAGRQRVLLEFDWERKIDRILDVYVDTLRRAGAGRTTTRGPRPRPRLLS